MWRAFLFLGDVGKPYGLGGSGRRAVYHFISPNLKNDFRSAILDLVFASRVRVNGAMKISPASHKSVETHCAAIGF